ncbi:FAD/NAD(P)-binding domain superfamily [Fusarium oxysporum f. sp. vasinfectum]|nr:FAD/NAD(P)-binding domain superfamily [Fusarium oxysporum f. sp. vasinfectum]
MAQLKVLICGAGIAGQALAFWLSKIDVDVTIIERFPGLRFMGLQLDLWGPGIEVMKRMGLEEAFREQTVQEQGLEAVNNSGRRIAYFLANRSGQGLQSFTTDFEIMRGDLCQLLQDFCKDRVKYIFGTTIESFDQKDGVVDGSRIRRTLLGPGVQDPTEYLGVYIAYFTIPKPLQKGEEYRSTIYIGTDRRFVFTRRNRSSRAQVYMAWKNKSDRMKHIRKGNVESEKQAFFHTFKGAGWDTDAFLEGMLATDDFYVALLGDAAYCPSASTGMGTTSSMVGAYVLVGEIEKQCGRSGNRNGLLDALKAYEAKFRPFMSQVQEGISEDQVYCGKIPSLSFGVAIINFVLWLAAFLRLDAISKWLLREDVQNWDLPDYDRMVYGAK